MADFRWHPNEPPPQIEDHSRAKLKVLRSYLSAYFDRLNVSPHREEFKLDLVDGFCGGGTFRDGMETVSGSPLIMLEEAHAAADRLNQGRAKHLRVDCRFYFVDKEQAHIDHLNRCLAERGYGPTDERVVVRHGFFEGVLESILEEIRRRQPRAGRAIFLLDQTGYAQVSLQLVARILGELPAAEVILTFATDHLLNHLSDTAPLIKSVFPLDLTEEKVKEMIRFRDGDGGRALVQRMLRHHIRSVTGAMFDTPFFIRPQGSRRALWFLHLSRHPTARDVMIQQHWRNRNTFEHYGSGGFDMLGWDALRELDGLTLFNFDELDAAQLDEQLLRTLPRELYALASENPVTIEVVQHVFANRTAATFEVLGNAILRLASEGEIQILTRDGRVRSRSLKNLRADDRITFPGALWLPGMSRLR